MIRRFLRKWFDAIQTKRSFKRPVRLSSGSMIYNGEFVAQQAEELVMNTHRRK